MRRKWKEKEMQKVCSHIFRERVSFFSLGLWLIRPSDSFKTRRKVVLSERTTRRHWFRGVSTNSIKVGVSSYLFYTLFKCFVMFELIKAVRGRLIGFKYWNRSVKIFGIFLVSPDQFKD